MTTNVNPIPPLDPAIGSEGEEPREVPTRENTDGDEVIDHDLDADGVDSAEADRIASGADESRPVD